MSHTPRSQSTGSPRSLSLTFAAAALVLIGRGSVGQPLSPAQPPTDALAQPAGGQPPDQPPADNKPPPPPPPAAGEAAPKPEPPPEEDVSKRVNFLVDFRGELGRRGDVGNTPGDLAVSRFFTGFAVAIPIPENNRLRLGFDYERSYYDFRNATGLAPGTAEPFDIVNAQRLSALFIRRENDQWSWMVSGRVGLSYEDGARVSDAWQVGGLALVNYAYSDRLTFRAGALGASRIEDDPLLLPILGVDWKIDDQWSLSVGGAEAFSLAYSPSNEWTFSLVADWESRNFRLDEDGPVPSGVGRDVRVPVSVGFSYTPNRQVVLTARVGVNAYEQISVDDRNGNGISEESIDPSIFLMAGFQFRF